jgi:hypothetical protein
MAMPDFFWVGLFTIGGGDVLAGAPDRNPLTPPKRTGSEVRQHHECPWGLNPSDAGRRQRRAQPAECLHLPLAALKPPAPIARRMLGP